MRIRVSKNGQITLPANILNRLGLAAGDILEAGIEDGRIVLAPCKRRTQKARIVTDPITGMAVLTAGPHAPILTSEQVREILADFP